ncbi:GNAT family N-acetyltransferase [Hasllibacter sp. MH4015]|uniref:GNAT family N-acetyltransferase n=1 Tax=Hasllibacter sp. MH4015 TaxID=2854029 RepID=UPI001CD3DE3E|nr:GNAT family N-acetyltransferase [Hasllibacter sp. MH4015]
MLRAAYAPMEGRIDPPSFLTTMTRADIARKAQQEDLFLARADGVPIACGFGTPIDDVYEIGKVAVADTHRRQGLARALMDAAARRARALGLLTLQLYARVELAENHATYRALGFHLHGPFTHEGYDRPTAMIFRRAV